MTDSSYPEIGQVVSVRKKKYVVTVRLPGASYFRINKAKAPF